MAGKKLLDMALDAARAAMPPRPIAKNYGSFSGTKLPDAEKLARLQDKFIYHSSTADQLENMKYGLDPQHGPWISEMAKHAGDIHPNELLEQSVPLVWMSDTPSWVSMKVGRKLNKPAADVTQAEIMEHGHLAMIPKKGDYAENVWKVGDEGLSSGEYSPVTNLKGETKKAGWTDLYENDYTGNKSPFGVERNEYISAQPVEPMFNLTGQDLIDFLNATGRAGKYHGGMIREHHAGGGEASMDNDMIERALRLARGGYADGGDAEVQSNSMPVISNGQVNWGDPNSAADFARADQAMQAMRSAPAAPEPQAAPMPMQRRAPAPAPLNVPPPPPRPAYLDRPYEPEGPFGALDMSSMQPQDQAYGHESPYGALDLSAVPVTPPAPTAPPAPSTDELLALLSNPTQSVASAAIDQAAPVAKFTDRAAPGISMTPQQRDLIIRTIAAESSGKTPEEGQGIAHVIMNRIMSGRYGKTPERVLFAPKQFEPWADPRGSNYPMRHKPGTTKYEKAQDALDAAMGGDDITGGATLFWGPKAQAALGRPAPKWGRTGGLDIGETRFHRDDGGMVEEREGHAGGKRVVEAALDALRGGRKIFPKPQRMFPEGARPPGGEFIDASTGEAVTGQKPARAVIGVTPEGKPVFLTDQQQVDVTGSPGKGSAKTMTNLFRKSAGWEWQNAPEGYENIPMIVSTKNRGQHYYSLGADYPKGVDLARYPKETSEPRLKPTTQGNVYPGDEVGTILNKKTGDAHPVYDMVTIRNLLAGTGAAGAGAAAMPDEGAAEPIEREAHAGGKRVVFTALEALRARAIPRVNPTEAADRVAFLLRNGRGNEVTNELAGAADPNTLLQHYLSGGTGAEMPMGQAARIGRAKEMGYHTEKPYYHAGDPKTAFDNSRGELYVTTDKPFAEAYRADKDYGDIRSLLSRHQNTIEGDDVVDFFHNKVSSLDPSGVNIKYGWQAFNPDHLAAAGGDPRDAAKLLPALKREGFDSAFFPEDFPPTSSYTDPSSSRAIFYPETLRDISARFDPRMSHVSDLGYASGGTVERALYLARGGYATPGFVDDQPEEEYPDGARPLTIYRNPNRAAPAGAMDVSGDQGPSYDQMGNVTSPGRNADPIVDAAMKAIPARSYAKDPELLAQEIQDYKRKVAEREATPEYYRQMTHYNISPPLAPVEIEGGFIGKRAIGEAPYDNAEARSKFFQTLYDMKTLPLYAAGSVFPPAAGLGMALDTAEGVAAGSPTQVAMGAFGAPGKVMKYGAAPLIAATGMLSPDEAQAAKLPKIGKAASGIAHAATPGGEMSLEQAMDIAKKAGSASARGKQAAPDEVSGLFDYSRLQEVPKVQQFNLPRNIPARGIPERVTELTVDPNVRSKMAEVISRGREMGGANWYNTDPLRDRFIQQLGAGAGDAAHRKFMDFVAATSPRSKVGENVRNASYYYGRDIRGEGMPAVGDKNPQPYGHMAQRLHQMNAERVAGVGWDPLNNPKPASFVENLVGNQQPATIDTHAFRLPAILAQDPRFLETAYLASKDAPKLNIQKMVNSGEMTLEDALKTPAYWQAQPKANEYGAMERYYQSIGRELGLTPAQTQASAWVGGGKLTGLGSDESKPFLRFFDDRIMKTAQERNMDPKDVLREFITGKSSLYADGGSVVDRALMLLSKQGR